MIKGRVIKSLLGLVIGFVLLVVALGLFLGKGKNLSERHQPFEFNEEFDFSSASFQEHIEYSQRLLRAAQIVSPSDRVVENASPFRLEPGPFCPRLEDGRYPKGIVLSHGLVASPYSMRNIGEYFQSRCFLVLAILMPGHATRPGDFLKIGWEDLAESQSFATRVLAEEVEDVYISGHSAGATLAIYEAAINPEIDGLVLFSPALEVTSASKYARVPALIGKVFDDAAWFEILQDDAIYRYESFTFSGAAEIYALIEATKEALAETPLSIPVFTVASVEDNTVATTATLNLMASLQNSLSKTLLYSQHSITAEEGVIAYNSYAPEDNVLSVSHLGLMVAPSHPHYGRDGVYRSCKHYSGESVVEGANEEAEVADVINADVSNSFQPCRAGERNYYGETTAENLAEGVLERIAFNPFYDDMLAEIDRFLDSLPQ